MRARQLGYAHHGLDGGGRVAMAIFSRMLRLNNRFSCSTTPTYRRSWAASIIQLPPQRDSRLRGNSGIPKA